jgi:hypothetical protein
MVWTCWRREKYLATSGIRTPKRSDRKPTRYTDRVPEEKIKRQKDHTHLESPIFFFLGGGAKVRLGEP